jgi:hypothetical protein
MPMKRFHLRRLTLAIYATVAAALAATVFLWGLEYKCSLYPLPSHVLQSVPVAKLLSERERPVKVQATHLARAPLAMAATFVLWLLFADWFRNRCAGLRPEPLPLQPTCAGLRFCSLARFLPRPPPVLLS